MAIAVQVVLRPFDFGHYMFLELDQCRGVDHHEVDILRARGLLVTARLFAGGFSIQHVDGRIEPGLRHQRLCSKARQDLTALRGVQVCDHAVQRRRDEQVAVFRGHLIFVHLRDGHTQRRQHRCAVRQIGCGGF